MRVRECARPVARAGRAIYRLPEPEPKPGEAVPVGVALQRLFWRMEGRRRRSESTGELVGSFGWGSADAMEQQDISDCAPPAPLAPGPPAATRDARPDVRAVIDAVASRDWAAAEPQSMVLNPWS